MENDKVSSSADLEILDSETQFLTSSDSDAKLCIANMAIKFNPDHFDPNWMLIKALISEEDEDEGKNLLFEKVSPGEWTYDGNIALTIDFSLIARWDETDNFGIVHLVKTGLEKMKEDLGLHDQIVQEFVTKAGVPQLRLVFELNPPDKNVTHLGDGYLTYEYLAKSPENGFARVLKISDNMPQKPWLLNLVGDIFLKRFDDTREISDIDNSVVAHNLAIQLLPTDDVEFLYFFNDSGVSVLKRYGITGNLDDINQAISNWENCVKAVDLTRQSHVDMSAWLNSLGVAFHGRFEHTGDLDDISEAISCQQKAIQLIPEGHANMPAWLNNLGISFQCRFDRTGDLGDISEAILLKQKAIQLTPEGHADMAAWLNNLGMSLGSHFDHTGDLGDISEAISCQQKAIQLTPEGHANMSHQLSSLGISFHIRFVRTGDLGDISEAISCQQKAIQLTPEGHADRDLPDWLNNLGMSLCSHFRRTGDLGDISEAISCQQKAIRLTPEGHADMPRQLICLGISFNIRFGHTGDFGDISEAISCQQKAIQLTPEGHASMPRFLHNLGISFQSRFDRTEDSGDISEAISLKKKALQLTPEGHPDMPSRLNSLGHSFRKQFRHTGNQAAIHAAISNFRRSATYLSGSPSTRLRGAKRWAAMSRVSDPSQLLEAYGTVVHLISIVAGLDQTIQKRYINLIDISKLSASAAAAAFHLEKHDLALEWLEQGRCLVWSQLNDLRTPLDDLRIHDPALADNLSRVSRALEKAGSRTEPATFSDETSMIEKMSIQDEAHAHVKLAQEWDQLLTKVRTMPNFEDFLKPTPCATLLKNIPDSGPVVVINIHKDRSDALALVSGADKPLHIALHKISFEKANNLRNELKTNLLDSQLLMRGSELDTRGMRYATNGAVIKNILSELWTLVVEPILNGLGYMESPLNHYKISRIWWCVTGPLAFLPLHAAGIYASGESTPGIHHTLSDFAVSSYTPTVRALIERVRNPQEITKNNMGLFMVSQPDAPTMARIPGTTKEIQALEQLLKSHNLQHRCLESNAATVNKVTENMGAYSCVHFACHAAQNTHAPLQSGFYLYDGRLDLSSIIKERFVGVDLAFLSACQTSTGDEKLSEEAVHLAAGMLAAGYRGVVATMWSIQDNYGPKFAENFYKSLIRYGADNKKGSEEFSGDGAAHALHHATQQARKELGESEEALLTWVPYVHFGL